MYSSFSLVLPLSEFILFAILTTQPLIGAISGYAVAGGLELALMCDVRIVEENAIFGVFCRRFGVPLIGKMFD